MTNRKILTETYQLTSQYLALQDQLPTTAAELQALKNKLTSDMAELDLAISINYNLRRKLISKIVERLDAHAIAATITLPTPPPGIVVSNVSTDHIYDCVQKQAIENINHNFVETQVLYMVNFILRCNLHTYIYFCNVLL